MEDTNKKMLEVFALETFVPALDFELSKSFYQDIGFEIIWSDATLAHIEVSGQGFLLQDFYVKAFAENFVMHLMVKNADEWWNVVYQSFKQKEYNYHISKPMDHAWGLRDFSFKDPSGVLWRIANKINV